MASLKDMRVRIASTKATQKITKAMQMVAASKLRRAQAAAEAARPYAERMGTVLGNIAAARRRHRQRAEASGRHRRGPGASAGRLHRRARPVRRVQLLDRAARARAANALTPQGKTVKILCVGRKGSEQLRRQYGRQIVEVIELRGVQAASASSMPRGSRARSSSCSTRAHSTSARCSSRASSSVIAQIPTAQQIIPPVFEAGARARRQRRLRIRAGGSRHPRRAAAAQHRRCRCSARCWKTPPPSRARACRRWTTPPATPAK